MLTLADWSVLLGIAGLIVFLVGWWFKSLGESLPPHEPTRESEKDHDWYLFRGWYYSGLWIRRIGLAALVIAGFLAVTVMVGEVLA